MFRRREMYRKKAAQFLREGKKTEARDCLSKCVDITPQMALELMNVNVYYILNIYFFVMHCLL